MAMRATPENNWCYDWLPKLDKTHDILQVFEDMNNGKMNGYICQGFNPLASAPCKVKVSGALAKLKYLVVIDPLATETSEFWQNHGEYNDVDPTQIQTEVFRLPSTCFAEEDGSLVNSSRWLQWHWKGAEPPGEARNDQEIIAGIFLKLQGDVQEGRRRLPRPDPEPDLALQAAATIRRRRNWPGSSPAGRSRMSPTPRTRPRCWSRPASSSTASPSCATTAPPPAAAGSSPGPGREKGNLMARRDNSDPYGIGQTLNWAYAWPANRRVLYNRASCDAERQALRSRTAS